MWLVIMPDDRSKPAFTRPPASSVDRVRDRRWRWALSQEAAAVRCGIHWTQLGKVERGQRSLRLETIVKIAHGLEVDAGELVSSLPVPQPRPTRHRRLSGARSSETRPKSGCFAHDTTSGGQPLRISWEYETAPEYWWTPGPH